MKIQSFIAVIATASTLLVHSPFAFAGNSKEREAKPLYKKLKSLPKEASGFRRTSVLLRKLVTINPKGAKSYYQLAKSRLSLLDQEAKIKKLQSQTIKIVERSDLSDKWIYKIKSQIMKKDTRPL